MSQPTGAHYNILITKEGTGALQATKEFQQLRAAATSAQLATGPLRVGLGNVAHASGHLSKALTENRMGLMEMEHTMRSLADVAIMGGSPRMFLAQIPQILQGLTMLGIRMSVLIPVLAGVGTVLADGLIFWHAWGEGEREVAERAKEIKDAMKDTVPMLERITNFQKAGLLSSVAAARYRTMLEHPQDYYVDQHGNITTSPYSKVWHGATFVGGGAFGGGHMIKAGFSNVKNRHATVADITKQQDAEITANNTVTDAQVSAINKLSELEKQVSRANLSDIAREKAAVVDKWDTMRQKMTAAYEVASIHTGGPFLLTMAMRGQYSAALAGTYSAQSNEIAQIDARKQAQELAQMQQMQAQAKAMAAEVAARNAEKVAALNQVMAKQRQLETLENRITLENLTGEKRKQEAIRQTTQAQIEQFMQLANSLGMSKAQTDQWIAKIKSGSQQSGQTAVQAKIHIASLGEMEAHSAESFASGFSSAFQTFISGTKNAGKAFDQFAASFLRNMSEMIIQSLILSAIDKSGLFGGKGFFGAAGGGVFPRFMATGGFAGAVSRPTYFPRFNVIAGEAGAEMLAVLARPTFRSVGGVDAVVGNAGPNRLALTSADRLASRGVGGVLRIQIDHTPETQARIVEHAVHNAVTKVSQDLRRHSPISKGVKNLVS